MNDTRLISTRLFALLVLLTVFAVSATSFVRYVFAKSYIFHVEMPCDTSKQNCYLRDCDDYCPPNGLAEYKVYAVKASEYKNCSNNSCVNVCLDSNKCTEIKCNPSNGDSCN